MTNKIAVEDEVLAVTGAKRIINASTVQSLWSGYGSIQRYLLEGGSNPSVIAKHIVLPKESNHPRGWNTSRSHQRKLKSYQVETRWYQQYAMKTTSLCRVPRVFHTVEKVNETLLIMEDLDSTGYALRRDPDTVSLSDVKSCLTWLAHFHASFMGYKSSGIWPIGTYWHLDTRPDEWKRMKSKELQQSATAIDDRLNQAIFKTIVHGDAKLANFCFSEAGVVAAVDFQYVGQGCGMKDVAYCISSCLDEAACEQYEEELLNHYFKKLEVKLDKSFDIQAVKNEWRVLYSYAWADFYRFLDGWSPDHWKMNSYSKRLTQEVLNDLQL